MDNDHFRDSRRVISRQQIELFLFLKKQQFTLTPLYHYVKTENWPKKPPLRPPTRDENTQYTLLKTVTTYVNQIREIAIFDIMKYTGFIQAS